MSNIEARVVAVVARKLRRQPAEIETNASITHDLGADSLDSVEIVMDLEDEFGLRIPDEHAESMRTVGDACDYMNRVLTQRSASPARAGRAGFVPSGRQ